MTSLVESQPPLWAQLDAQADSLRRRFAPTSLVA